MTKIKTQQHKSEIFTIFSNEIQGRLDPYFYRVEFRELEKKLKNFNSAVRNSKRNRKRS